jgi:hypothetical protein
VTPQDDRAAGIPVAGAGRDAEEAHGGSIFGTEAGTPTGDTGGDPGQQGTVLDPLEQPAAGGDSEAESAQGDGAPDSH